MVKPAGNNSLAQARCGATVNTWEPDIEAQKMYYRQQSRVDLNIDLQLLLSKLPADQRGSLWFHATDWQSARGIIENGPSRRTMPSDFSNFAAFYLNDDYRDCYQRLLARNSVFRGCHAIVIFQFERDDAEIKSYALENEKEWQQLVFSCLNENQKKSTTRKSDCVYGYQCSNPENVRVKSSTMETPKIRKTEYDENKAANQLASITATMDAFLHKKVVGCVWFQCV